MASASSSASSASLLSGFKNGALLTMSLLPAIGVTLAFGGRLSIQTAAFGFGLAHTFDSLGSMEGSLLVILLTFLAVWTTLIYAARFILLESMWHFSLLGGMGLVLLCLFLVILGHYNAIRADYDSLFYLAESVMFAIVPWASTIILTWFVCVELPMIDIAVAFPSIYFAYVIMLAKPLESSIPKQFISSLRTSSTSSSGSDNDKGVSPYTLSLRAVMSVYFLPIIVTPILYLCMHHNVVFYKGVDALFSIGSTIVYPSLLMVICMNRHVNYFHVNERKAKKSLLENLETILFLLLGICLQNHPIFDDIKALSYRRTWMTTLAICVSMTMLVATILLIRVKKHFAKLVDDALDISLGYKQSSNTTSIWISRFCTLLVYVSVICAAIVGSYVFGLSAQFLPLSAFVGFAVVYYYTNLTTDADMMTLFPAAIMILLACVFSQSLFQEFLNQTISFLHVTFYWYMEIPISIICKTASWSVAVAIAIPALGHLTRALPGMMGKIYKSVSFLPSNSSFPDDSEVRQEEYFIVSLLDSLFEIAIQVIAIFIALMELLIREQTWENAGLDVETVYPSYLMISTSLVLIYTAFHLRKIGMISFASLWWVIVTSVCKCTHLYTSISSLDIACLVAITFAYTIPVIDYFDFDNLWDRIFSKLSGYDGDSNSNPDGYNSRSDSNENIWKILVYCTQGAFVTEWFRRQMSHSFLVLVYSRDPSDAQVTFLAASMFTGFVLLNLAMFFNHVSTTLRIILVVLFLVFSLITVDGLGPFSLTLNAENKLVLTFSHSAGLSSNEHVTFFFIVTVTLAVGALIKLIPIKSSFNRLIYLLVLSFTSTKVFLTWSYPLSLSQYTSHHEFNSFQFVHTFIFVLLAISTIINGALVESGSTAGFMVFQMAAVWDIFGCMYCYFFHNDETLEGVLWSSLTVFLLIALAIRIADLRRDISDHVARKESTSTSSPSLGAVPHKGPVIVAIAVFIALLTAVVISCISHHVDTDLFVPFISVAFLLTRRGLLVEDRHPLHLIVVSSMTWWLLRVVFHIFVKDWMFPSEVEGFDGSDIAFFGLIHNFNLSIFRTSGSWYPWVQIGNMIMAGYTFFSAIFCFQSTVRSDEVVFALSLLDGIAILAANSVCIRFMGCISAIYCAWMCYKIGNNKTAGNRLI